MSTVDLDDELAAYWARCCEGKLRFGPRSASEVAAKLRAEKDSTYSAYRCSFCDAWHVGRAMSLDTLTTIARLLRARAGNAPSTPGSGTTRRQRRRQGKGQRR